MATPGETVVCPCCQSRFECLAGTGEVCHCSAVALSGESLKAIARDWEGCLCVRCLREFGGSAGDATEALASTSED